VGPRADLNDVEKKKMLPILGFEPFINTEVICNPLRTAVRPVHSVPGEKIIAYH
jgi:hypothetical protein